MYPEPIIFTVGAFSLRWYSVMIVLGAVVAAWLATREARRRGQDPEHIWQMMPIVLIFGIIGARLGWVLVSLKDIEAKGWEHALAVWEGGLSIQGALVGGIIAAVIYTRRYHFDFFEWADIIIPGVALAQAIGRWGNYFNQEAFGAVCNNPWCISISDEVLRSHPEYAAYVGQNLRFAPTFAYEMIWDLLNFALLMWLGRQSRVELRTGDLFWVYGIVYSVGRFFIEDIRLDSATVNGLRAPQVFAILTIVVCWAALIWRHRPGSTAPVAVVADTATTGYTADWDDDGDAAAEDSDADDGAYAADGDDGEYAVEEDEAGEPVEPVPHPAPVIAQARDGESSA
ncbi:MAG TPA: prolipoprotein diacylglyceryl transferase [Chloroflexia bacterium]|nr:prolipoprotein diacylglyceryl transferase [Chloroflexia bacterium]